VEAEADRLVMIHNGRLVFSGELADIMQKACDAVYVVPENTADLPLLTGLVSDAGYLFRQEDAAIIIAAPKEWSSEMNRLAWSKGINLRELRPQRESLEDIFLSMTRGEVAK
jgi:ABC-type multidrug transport system ATPase subunit